MRIVQLCCILGAILLILFQKIDILYSNNTPSSLHINLSVFSFSLFIGKKRKRRFKDRIKALKSFYIYLKAFNFLLSHSDVTIKHLQGANITPPGLAKAIPFALSMPAAFAYLSSTAKSFNYLKSEKNDPTLATNTNSWSADMSFRFIHLIISALLLLYYKIKSILRRSKINV